MSDIKINFVFRQITETIITATPEEIFEFLANREDADTDELTPQEKKEFGKKIVKLMSRKDNSIVLQKETESLYTENLTLDDDHMCYNDMIEEYFTQEKKKAKLAKQKTKIELQKPTNAVQNKK